MPTWWGRPRIFAPSRCRTRWSLRYGRGADGRSRRGSSSAQASAARCAPRSWDARATLITRGAFPTSRFLSSRYKQLAGVPTEFGSKCTAQVQHQMPPVSCSARFPARWRKSRNQARTARSPQRDLLEYQSRERAGLVEANQEMGGGGIEPPYPPGKTSPPGITVRRPMTLDWSPKGGTPAKRGSMRTSYSDNRNEPPFQWPHNTSPTKPGSPGGSDYEPARQQGRSRRVVYHAGFPRKHPSFPERPYYGGTSSSATIDLTATRARFPTACR